MPTNRWHGPEPFPVRGDRCRDWWDTDAVEIAAIRRDLAACDTRAARIAAQLRAEEEQERRHRRDRVETAVGES